MSDGAKRVGSRELGYFKWWVTSDKWWVTSDEWWVTKIEWGVMSDGKKKKKTKQPLNTFKKHILISKRHISITLEMGSSYTWCNSTRVTPGVSHRFMGDPTDKNKTLLSIITLNTYLINSLLIISLFIKYFLCIFFSLLIKSFFPFSLQFLLCFYFPSFFFFSPP